MNLTEQEMRELLKCSKSRLIKNTQDYRVAAWDLKNNLDIAMNQVHQLLEIERKYIAETDPIETSEEKGSLVGELIAINSEITKGLMADPPPKYEVQKTSIGAVLPAHDT